MNNKAMSRYLSIGLALATVVSLSTVGPQIVGAQRLSAPAAVAAAFTYQGHLTAQGQPADGAYDFEFAVFADMQGGNAIGTAQTVRNVAVRGGAFAAPLDLGAAAGDGPRYLQIGVRPGGSAASFIALSPRQIVPSGATTTAPAPATLHETWRLGFTREGPPTYSAVIGRVAGGVAAFRSEQAADIYFIFPGPATQKTVQSASLYVLSGTGDYSGSATLALEVIGYDGTRQHTASAAAMDIKGSAAGAWTSVGLSGTAGDWVISPGEFLAFHFHLDGAPGGNLDVRPMFEVEVQ
jgi:hypothetical protein